MFGNFSESDLAIVAILLDDEEESCTNNVWQKSERKRKIWVHDILKKRKTEGEFATVNTGIRKTNFRQNWFFLFYFNNVISNKRNYINKNNQILLYFYIFSTVFAGFVFTVHTTPTMDVPTRIGPSKHSFEW